MSKVAVVMYRCDGCAVTGDPESKDPRFPNASIKSRLFGRELLPEDWYAFKTVSNMGDGDTMHFCPECSKEASRLITGLSLGSKDIEGLGVKSLIEESEQPKKEE